MWNFKPKKFEIFFYNFLIGPNSINFHSHYTVIITSKSHSILLLQVLLCEKLNIKFYIFVTCNNILHAWRNAVVDTPYPPCNALSRNYEIPLPPFALRNLWTAPSVHSKHTAFQIYHLSDSKLMYWCFGQRDLTTLLTSTYVPFLYLKWIIRFS